jgi:hypothetical protein
MRFQEERSQPPKSVLSSSPSQDGFCNLESVGNRGPPPPAISGSTSENLPSGHHWGVLKTGLWISANKPLPSLQLPMARDFKTASFSGIVADQVVFPFSVNPSATHYPPSVRNSQGWQRSAVPHRVYRSVHELKL